MTAAPLSFSAFAQETGAARGLFVLAPHPDDEALGCGGLIALAAAADVPVRTVFLTDGEASHPGSLAFPKERLAARRRQEARRALHVLGVSSAPLFLGLPDGGAAAAARESRAADRLASLLTRDPPGLAVTTWRGERHTDHRCAFLLLNSALSQAALPVTLGAFEVWGPLMGRPSDRPAARGLQPRRLALGAALAKKRRAFAAHESQRGRLIPDDPGGFVMQAGQVDRLMRRTETYWFAAP